MKDYKEASDFSVNPDRYNQPEDYAVTSAMRREHNKQNVRFNAQFLPVEDEILKNWMRRIERACDDLERFSIDKHILGHKTWYCHTGYSSCFICDAFTVIRFMMKFTTLDLDRYCWQLNGDRWDIVSRFADVS